MSRGRHQWRLVGAASGWEVYECTACGRGAIPSVLPFGPFWIDVLRWMTFGNLGGCPKAGLA